MREQIKDLTKQNNKWENSIGNDKIDKTLTEIEK